MIHEGLGITRQDKIKLIIKKYVNEKGICPQLQVCNYEPLLSNRLNCGYCEKCARTITGLLTENIDPERCALPLRDDLYQHIETYIIPKIENLSLPQALSGAVTAKNWKIIQEHIKIDEIRDYHGSKKFLKWLKEYEIKEKQGTKINYTSSKLLPIISKLPRNIQNWILKTIYKIRYHRTI